MHRTRGHLNIHLWIGWLGLLLLCCVAQPLWAGSLTADVSSRRLDTGERLTLDVRLHEATAQNEPDFNRLRQDFDIEHTAIQRSNLFINGRRMQVQRWQLTLIPKRQGWLVIPSLEVYTEAGRLQSQPIAIAVGNPQGKQPSLSAPSTASTRNASPATAAPPSIASAPTRNAGQAWLQTRFQLPATLPYVGQPVPVSLVISHTQVKDIEISPPTAEGGRIDIAGDIENREAMEGGRRMQQSVLHFLVTPLEAEGVTIHPVDMKGYRLQALDPGFARDPFGLVDRMLRQLQNLEAFTAQSKSATLGVRPIPAIWTHGSRNWRPAWEMQLVAEWGNTQRLDVGQPVTVNLTVTAKGLFEQHLPDLPGLLKQVLPEESWDIYEELPEQETHVTADPRTTFSFRKQQVTLVPKHGGELRIPDLRFPWWDLRQEQEAEARTAGTVFYVSGTLPQTHTTPTTRTDNSQPASAPVTTPEPDPSDVALTTEDNLPLWRVAIIGGGGMLLLAGVAYLLWWRHKKHPRHTASPSGGPSGGNVRTDAGMMARKRLQAAQDDGTLMLAAQACLTAESPWIHTAPMALWDMLQSIELNGEILRNAYQRWEARHFSPSSAPDDRAGDTATVSAEAEAFRRELLHHLERTSPMQPETSTQEVRLPPLNYGDL